jgi:hypothetical protein
LLKKKIDEKVLLVHPVTSLDDAIDVNLYVFCPISCGRSALLTETSNENLAAVYAFAAPASAKYLTQFIDADISWVNHVPSHMLSTYQKLLFIRLSSLDHFLCETMQIPTNYVNTYSPVGPALPRNTPYSPQTRYAPSHFQKPRAQLINPSATANATQIILGNENTVRSDALWREALAPLPSTKQRPGFKIGFFEQGIITGVSLTLISLVATVSTLGYYTWTYVKLRG